MQGQRAGSDRRIEQSVVLVGFMAAGKSKIGSCLAERLEVPFTDLDRAIEEQYGCSIADLFRERGEVEFRKAEAVQIKRLLSAAPHVIAIGGGAFINADNRKALNCAARTVWLDTPFELILPRLLRSTARPLAAGKSESELRALWEERRKSYEAAQLRIDTSDADIELIVERIVAALN